MCFLPHVFFWSLGSYFARDVSYSHQHCPPSTDHHSVSVAQAHIGDFAQANQVYLHSPTRPGISNRLLDSCANNWKKKSFHLCHFWEAPHLPCLYLGGYMFTPIKVMSEATISCLLHVRTSCLTFGYVVQLCFSHRSGTKSMVTYEMAGSSVRVVLLLNRLVVVKS